MKGFCSVIRVLGMTLCTAAANKKTLTPNPLTFNSFTTKFLILQKNSLITTFYSSQSESNFIPLDKNPQKAERVLTLFRAHGFSETQISRMVRMRPRILLSDPKKNLIPKLNFFRSIGLSRTDMPRILSLNPSLLGRSLKNQLIPCHNSLKNVLVLDENVVKMLKKNSRILTHDFEKNIGPNISSLSGVGVPKSLILFMLFRFPSVAHQNHEKFKKAVEKVIEMGFNPLRTMFVQAVQVICEMTKMTWDRKWAAFRRWGLSDDKILLAFRSHPLCMNLSEEKITRGMDFLANKMGCEAVKVARCPAVLFYNLENRIIPRCRVIKVLISEGILKKDMSLGTFLVPSENQFLERFVSNYEDKVPELLDVYRGKTVRLKTGLRSKD
ncbi:hypothetical protein LguiB_017915 [Lonicera macranthoides]